MSNIKVDNTFSIIAYDAQTNVLGIAVATARLAVGNRVPFIKSGVGVIATQANTNIELGYKGLTLLEQGLTAPQVLEIVLGEDCDHEERQLSIIDAIGNRAAFTGIKTQNYKAHLIGPTSIVAGNFLAGPEVLIAMQQTFNSINLPLAEKLLLALEAGQKAGGDKRGKVSAALKVVTNKTHPYLDLRVDKSNNPILDLRSLYESYKKSML